MSQEKCPCLECAGFSQDCLMTAAGHHYFCIPRDKWVINSMTPAKEPKLHPVDNFLIFAQKTRPIKSIKGIEYQPIMHPGTAFAGVGKDDTFIISFFFANYNDLMKVVSEAWAQAYLKDKYKEDYTEDQEDALVMELQSGFVKEYQLQAMLNLYNKFSQN